MTFSLWQFIAGVITGFGLGGMFAVLVWPRRS